MKALLLVLVVAIAALAAATHASARAACTAGTHSAGGVTYRTFCGPAHATLKDGGKTYTFKGGSCSKTGSTWTINIGTITLATGKSTYTYFGITVFGKKAGKYANQAMSWQFPHNKTGSLFKTTVTLASGLKKGTFSGSNILGGGKGSGSFSCG